ncbi:MAG TPA: amidohydrolase family protein [Clostridia bacterium]|nr:amidohydrolase family protein [Clostridia bacterium]
MYDLVIKNAEIIDGSGKISYISDIGIKDGYINTISLNIEEDCDNVIDAEGLIVCPGFIDIDSHSDFSFFSNSKAESKVRQGITTEVIGQGGHTLGPINDKHLLELREYTHSYVQNKDKINYWTWKSQTDFIDILGKRKIAVNIASLVGYGTIRVAVMGFEKRKPSKIEMDEMKKLLEEELVNGIHGLSLGLDYTPDSLATMLELVEMAKIVKKHNGICSIHMRDEGNNLIKSIHEVIEISEKSGVKIQISHLKAAHPQNWGNVKEAIRIINKAKQSGLDIDYDVYPYTSYESVLSDVLPPWIRELSPLKIVELLKDEEVRKKVVKDMIDPYSDWGNPMLGSSWEQIRIVSMNSQENKKYEGMNIEQISRQLNQEPWEVAIKLLIKEEGVIKIIFSAMIETDLVEVMKQSMAIYCTDGLAVSPYGDYKDIKLHPRYYGTYPRILGKYIREKQIIPLEDAINKMTLLPSIKMNINDRGLLAEGYKADITIFDKDKIIDKATFDDPHQYPEGIKAVIVNGVVVVLDNNHTGELPGEVIKRK